MRPGMTQKLVLFDIDGTLLLSGGAGRRALVAVMSALIDDPAVFDRVRFDGKTDPQIIAELLLEAGHGPGADSEMVERMAERYLELLEDELADGGTRRGRAGDGPGTGAGPRLMPGVPELLDGLEADSRATLGLLTGNLARGAALKLRSVGIDPARFAVGAYGSDSPHRPDLPAIATRHAGALFGRIPVGEEVVIIGDTPADVTCGESIGARAIGVATGSYSREDLEAAGAYLVVEDLADGRPVLDAIFS